MTRRTTQTFHGWAQPDVVVTFPDDHEHPGEHPGLLRAWAVDDETGDWWATCSYYVGTGIQMLGWVHQDHVRPIVELTDDDGLVDPGRVVALPQRATRPGGY
jgi:hypothetical protein